MRKIVWMALVAVMVMSLAACGAGNTPATPGTSTPSASAAPTESANPVESTAPTSDKKSTDMSGVLNAMDTTSITITTKDNLKLCFKYDDVKMPDHLVSGSNVVLTYTGTVNGTDTKNATLTKVTTSGGTVTGTVQDAAMNSFTLKLEDGTALQFSTTDDTIKKLPNGMTEGLTVTVKYTMSAENGGCVANTITATQ